MVPSRSLVAAAFAVVALVGCASHASAATVTGTLGTAVTVPANAQTTINYGSTFFNLGVMFPVETTVTLSAAAAVNALPAGYTALSFDGSFTFAGLQLSYSYTGQMTSAITLTTPPLASASAALIAGSVTAGALRWDTTAQAYTTLGSTSYTSAAQVISMFTMSPGTMVFAAVAAGASVPTLYQEFRDTSATSATLSFPGGFEMDVATTTANKVTVNRDSFFGAMDPNNYHNVGAFFTITLMTSEAVTAKLRYTYDASLSMAVANDLRFASYTNSAWEFQAAGGTVDTNTRVVSQTTTHFSTWGVFQNSNDGDGMSATNQALTSDSPTKCYAVDYDLTSGAVTFNMTKNSGAGNLRMYLKKASSGCPSAADFQMQTQLVTDDGDSDALCTSAATPSGGDVRFILAVYGEGLSSTAGAETTFDLTAKTSLLCSASPVTKVLSLAALAVLAAVAAMLA